MANEGGSQLLRLSTIADDLLAGILGGRNYDSWLRTYAVDHDHVSVGNEVFRLAQESSKIQYRESRISMNILRRCATG